MYFMLFCTLVVAVSEAQKPLIPLPAKLIALIVEKSPECIAKTGARPEAVQQFFIKSLENNETTKKYNFCLFKSIGLSDDNGHFYVDRVSDLYKYNDYNEILGAMKTSLECNKIVAENPIETIYQVLQCFSDRAPAWIPKK